MLARRVARLQEITRQAEYEEALARATPLYEGRPVTTIHRFDLSDLTHTGSGRVEGHLDTTGGQMTIDHGHVAGPDLTVTIEAGLLDEEAAIVHEDRVEFVRVEYDVRATAEKIRRLPWNTAMGAINNIFAVLTFFGSAFILFVNEIGASNSQIGFLLSLLPFTGLIALFIAPQVARFGYKRTFITFFTLRKFITGGLLFVPWVAATYGSEPALTLIAVVVIGFALCRAIAETAMFPWSQEFIPNSIRGKHAALNDMVARITGILATAFAGYVLGASDDLSRFIVIFAVALIAGIISARRPPESAVMDVVASSPDREVSEAVNAQIMTLYLWHLTAMVIVLGISIVLGGFGLGVEPATTPWWLTRPVWFVVVGVVTAGLVTLFGRFERPLADTRPAPPAWRTMRVSCAGLDDAVRCVSALALRDQQSAIMQPAAGSGALLPSA